LLDKVKDDSTSKDGKPAQQGGKTDRKTQPDPPPGTATKARLRVFTIVRAPDLDYNDDTRLAHYGGGATLERPEMTVKGQDIHAFLRNDSNDSSLDHAVADGHVEVHDVGLDRVRDAWSDHAEYYVDEDKVILEGGLPRFVDSTRGTTRGQKLTWYSSDDRLLVDGVPQQPVKSVLHRKTVNTK
jgi:lipopolysaccharide export system protein LptA